MRYEAVLFDCDGVITESEDIKTQAFAELFKEFGEDVKNKVIEHQKTSRISRFEKFKLYYKEYLGKDITNEELEDLGNRFSNIVNPKVMSAPFVPGIIETLEKLNNENIPCFVVTGAPVEEAIKIIEAKKIKHYFKGIYGAPKRKEDNIKDIIKNYNPSKTVFLGDAMSDFEAAQINGIDFIGIVRGENPFPDTIKIQNEVYID